MFSCSWCGPSLLTLVVLSAFVVGQLLVLVAPPHRGLARVPAFALCRGVAHICGVNVDTVLVFSVVFVAVVGVVFVFVPNPGISLTRFIDRVRVLSLFALPLLLFLFLLCGLLLARSSYALVLTLVLFVLVFIVFVYALVIFVLVLFSVASAVSIPFLVCCTFVVSFLFSVSFLPMLGFLLFAVARNLVVVVAFAIVFALVRAFLVVRARVCVSFSSRFVCSQWCSRGARRLHLVCTYPSLYLYCI